MTKVPQLVQPREVWDGTKWTEDFQVWDYARLGLEFVAGHLPGARHVEKTLVWTTVDGVAGMLPPAADLSASLGREGFDPRRPALVYDGGNGLYGARLAWALVVAGWERVALLQGGLAAWKQEGFPISRGTAARCPATSLELPWLPELYATAEKVKNRSAATVLLDTRTRAEFVGKDRRSARAGRIPGAVHWDWSRALEADGLTFRSREDLAAEFAAFGIHADTPVITYCQSGVRAAHALLALQRAGIRQVSNYDGSWEEWGNRQDWPLVTGEES